MKTVADIFKEYKVSQIDRMLELLGNATDAQKSILCSRHWYMVTDAIEFLEKGEDCEHPRTKEL